MEKVFAIKLDEKETKRFDNAVNHSGLKNGAAFFRFLLKKYELEEMVDENN